MRQMIDETGNVYGKLTVLGKSTVLGLSKTNKWRCRCECGNVKDIFINSLRTGDTKSCGCRANNKPFDEVGKTYGRLTVLERIENDKNSRAMYKCACECGKITFARGVDLRTGKKRSCGCEIQDYHRSLTKDEVGNIYGRLTVIAPSHMKRHNDVSWECLCACGTIKIVSGVDLRAGEVKSCGCLLKENHWKNRKIDFTGAAGFRQVYKSYQRSARERNLEWQLSEDIFLEMTTSVCHYCGQEPSKVKRANRRDGVFVYNGVDRKDNSSGYISGNVVTCCLTCNYLKGARGYEEFLEIIEKIYNHRVRPSHEYL